MIGNHGEASPRTLARTAGWLYLVIIVCAGFAEGYVRGTLVVPGDAAVTAANIGSAPGLFRLGLAADLVAFLADAAVAVLLYVLTGAFFGVHCALLGYLVMRSELFPTLLGVLLVAAGASYLAESLSPFAFPAVEGITAGAVVVAAGVAEVSLCLWLIAKGVRDRPSPA